MKYKTTSEISNARKYIDAYENRWNKCFEVAKLNGSDDPGYDATIEFDEVANADEIVGYYLVHHEWNPYGDWLSNTTGIEMNNQDKEVTKILQELCS